MAGHESTDRLLSPSKISAWLDCEHYLTVRRAADRGDIAPTNEGMGSFARLLLDKGLRHEHDYLRTLRADGLHVFEVEQRSPDESFRQWVDRTSGVLAEGHDVVYQLPMIHGTLRGVADFLIRVDTPSNLGSFSYEPVDAKLTRAGSKPGHVLQLCFYADALETSQGRRPAYAHVYLGSGESQTITLANVDAYWRRIRSQLSTLMASDDPADTKPEPCQHCPFCEFADLCESQWRADDALHYVAGIRAPEIATLRGSGVSTMTDLARATVPVEQLDPARLRTLVRQASLQKSVLPEGPPPFERLDIPAGAEGERARLPEPNEGDVFLDYEGHPFWTPARGLFFLFGLLYRDDGTSDWTYEARWAHDVKGEAQQTLDLIAFLDARNAAFPGMHVYHYNHTERSALERLAEEHGANKHLLAELVRSATFVDLLDVVRQSVAVGTESYGLKAMELLTGFERSHDIDRGSGAVVEYENWMAGDGLDDVLLNRIARYNEDDVRATLAVRDWLRENVLTDQPARQPPPDVDVEEDAVPDEVVASLMASEEPWKVLLAHLLDYWRREEVTVRTQRAVLLDAPPDDRLANEDVITGLELVAVHEPTGRQRNRRVEFSFPAQAIGRAFSNTKGAEVLARDALGRARNHTCVALDLDAGRLQLRASADAGDDESEQPGAIVVHDYVWPRPKPGRLLEFATQVVSGEVGDSDHRVALLRRDLPRFAGAAVAEPFPADAAALAHLAQHLDGSYLAVQGPPGTGKTYTAARLIATLIDRGLRVGVTAVSHAAIDNLIGAILGVTTTGNVLRQGSPPIEQRHPEDRVRYRGDRATWNSGGYQVLAGTSWFFARDEMCAPTPAVDVLFIDEAGQMGLADALAAMAGARNVVLLGDPLQLAQVSVASHPGDAGSSVLEHVLGEDETMPADRGVFLDTSYRMHPAICAFISDQIYEGRLRSADGCTSQSVNGSAGLRWIPVNHSARSTESPEEAEAVRVLVRELLGSVCNDQNGRSRSVQPDDIIVVAPYNDQVNLVRRLLEEDPLTAPVRVGTVDRFQGQEALVVIFTMATSSGADIPRTADFLFSRNRLNVAISRARALAYVICNEALLDTRARTVEEMHLIGTLCAFVEDAHN
jgi:predicted RecB family nuclease